MARTVQTPYIGQRVYRNFRPKVAGKIIDILGPVTFPRRDGSVYVSTFTKVKIKWVNGSESEHSTNELADFDALIEDHKKKLATHLETLKKLENSDEQSA